MSQIAENVCNEETFSRLFRKLSRELHNFLYYKFGADNNPKDLVQEAFVAAWHALARYDQKRSFGIWLKRIAINKCRDWRRRRAVRAFFYKAENIDRPGLDIVQPILTGNDNEDELSRLDTAIAALPSNLKEPLLLSLTEDMSHREIAEALGITAKAVEVRIYRAKRALAEALGTR